MNLKPITPEDCAKPEVKTALDELGAIKADAIAKGDEELANRCWREEQALKLNILYIGMFQKLKLGEYRQAWIDLEQCEIACKFLRENSPEPYYESCRAAFIEVQVSKWQSVFPYCLFFSPAMKVGFYTCSICDHKIRPRSRCAHVTGRVYDGELCVRVAHDVELLEISLVQNPVQKYSVAHNDETLDFSLVEHSVALLDHPFEWWGLEWKTKAFPIGDFASVDAADSCPCKSGKTFKECCQNKAQVEIPHVDFVLQKQILDEDQKTQFPY